MNRTRWYLIVVGVFVVFGLPCIGHWLRSKQDLGCALDGAPIHASYRVRIEDAHGESVEFCCIACAQAWLAFRDGSVDSVFVTDEASGEEIDAAKAFFVRSQVVTTPHTGNRVHAFRREVDAQDHADRQFGSLLPPDERPFAWLP